MSQPVLSTHSAIAWTKLPDGAVLFSPETEVYFGMNDVATLIWDLLSRNPSSQDALCLAVHEQFPGVSLEQVRQDVAELLQELTSNGLVTSIEAQSAA